MTEAPEGPAPAASPVQAPEEPMSGEQMARLGITRVPADQFHYREFRYGRLSDAIAQAERDLRIEGG